MHDLFPCNTYVASLHLFNTHMASLPPTHTCLHTLFQHLRGFSLSKTYMAAINIFMGSFLSRHTWLHSIQHTHGFSPYWDHWGQCSFLLSKKTCHGCLCFQQKWGGHALKWASLVISALAKRSTSKMFQRPGKFVNPIHTLVVIHVHANAIQLLQLHVYRCRWRPINIMWTTWSSMGGCWWRQFTLSSTPPGDRAFPCLAVEYMYNVQVC